MGEVRRQFHITPVDGAYAVIIIALCVTIIRTFIGEYALDDSFIGYDNAQNLATGHGFGFNPGDHELTTSAPLAVFLYAAVELINHSDILSIAQTFAALACLTIGLTGYLLARKFSASAGALAVSIILLGSPYTLLLWSHESYLCLAMTLVGLLLFEEDYLVIAAVVIGLAALMRPEAVLTVPFVIARLWLRGRPLEAVRFGIIAIGPIVLWSAAALFYFGSFMSQSIAAKHAQLVYNPVSPYLYGLAALPSQVLALGYFQVIPQLLYVSIAAVWIGSLIAGTVRSVHWAVVLWSLIYTALYVVVGVPFFLWFAIQIGILVALSAAVAWPLSTPSEAKPVMALRSAALAIAKVGSVCIAGICLLFLLIVTGQQYRLLTFSRTLVMPLVDVSAYRQLGTWLSVHTAPSDTIAYPEIGQIRYYSSRSIVDFEGLVNRGVAQHVALGDTIWAFKQYRPTVYVDQPAWYDFVQPTEFDWFNRAYRHTDSVPIMMYPTLYNFDIYRLIDPTAIPKPDDLDDHVNVQSVESNTGGVRINFRPSGPGLDQVDVRTLTRAGCPHGTISISALAGGVIASRGFVERPTPAPSRISLQFGPIDGSNAESFTVEIRGCAGLALAPRTELRKVGLFDFTKPVAPVGPPAEALAAYLR